MAAIGKPRSSISDTNRLKRENCKLTKHDSAFSEWKILIGPSDWKDHSIGKEGAERYRVHNLLTCCSCPGVYELGVAVKLPRSGRKLDRLDPGFILPVYLGQAENVRTRLQRYGRDGAHLENKYSNDEQTGCVDVSLQKGLGLFTEIFSKGFSIVYRWAPMKNKRDAEKTEAQLLEIFDYAWNKGGNCTRRSDDICQKLDQSYSVTSFVTRKLLLFRKKQGIKINVCKSLPSENGSSFYDNDKVNNLLPQILKFGRSQPRLVSAGKFGHEGDNSICGVALGQGSVCIRPPVEGRKRCAEHKGMKINASIQTLIIEEKLQAGGDMSIEFDITSYPDCPDKRDIKVISSSLKSESASLSCKFDEDFSFICGVAVDDGSVCRRKPVKGRKRCGEHKGRRIRESQYKPLREENEHNTLSRDYGMHNSEHEHVSSRANKPTHLKSHIFSRSSVAKKCEPICGVGLENETVCTRQPVFGRKRCDEHRGMRVKVPIS